MTNELFVNGIRFMNCFLKFVVAMQFMSTLLACSPIEETSQTVQVKPQKIEIKADNAFFACDDRQFCEQMRSQKEAEFFHRNCANIKLVVDENGVACGEHFNAE